MAEARCNICNKSYPEDQLITGHGIRHEVEKLIMSDYPEWNDKSRICKDDFDTFRMKYIVKIIEDENGSVEGLKDAVISSIRENELISSDVNVQSQPLKVGEKIADGVAAFGGSWRFIILFFCVLLGWILLNVALLFSKPFDPYPFILLNLILSCLAAIQAPVIMMSQNRQEKKDRIRSENDYKVNLKSEIEIRTLHEKVDHLLLDQWSKMMKIQEIEIELLQEIRDRSKNNNLKKD